MPTDLFDDQDARRPIWLVTLADLMLLLVGLFVFLQSNVLDGRAVANGLRNGFGVQAEAPMPVDASIVGGFATGSAALPAMADAEAWAIEATRDPRTTLRVIGGTDGSAQDVDPVTGSAAILASDRARAVAARLAKAAPGRIAIENHPGAGRAVQLQIGFAGVQP